MEKQFFKDAVGWGVGLWVIGYVLGVLAFMVVPAGMIGWVVSPIGILITLWVLVKKVQAKDAVYYLKVALVWTAIAIVFDYLFLVLLFKPADGYYKLDVYLYYAFTFVLPLVVGILKNKKSNGNGSFNDRQTKEKVEHKQKILEMFVSNDKISNDDAQKLLGVSDATVTRYLDELEKEGQIKQVGQEGRFVYYQKA